MSGQTVQLPNRHLDSTTNDFLFHFDIALDDTETINLFTDVKFVCVGGTSTRMETLATHFADALQHRIGQDNRFDFSCSTDRYSMFKTGPVLCVNHGIGTPSANVVLQEVFKLLRMSGASDVTLFRIGTCGGLGIPPGTLAISTGVLTPGLRPVFRTSSLGKVLELPVKVDQGLTNQIFDIASQNGVKVVKGKTYCADGFYEAQGRLDGAFCDYSEEDRMTFLRRLREEGVVNLEMESAGILALSQRAGIPAAVICGVLVDRLEADLPDMRKCPNVQSHLLDVISRYVLHKIGT